MSTPRRIVPYLRAVLRESRAAHGRLFFFAGCLAVGVAAVVGVSALVAAVGASLRSQSRELLAADVRVSARRPLPEAVDGYLSELPHERADVLEMAAMASTPQKDGSEDGSGGRSRLVELKVVEPGYPFYGTLTLSPAGPTTADLGADSVFAAPEVIADLGLAVGEELALGGERFRVAAAVLDEPDRLDFALTLGPRVFVSPEGLARTDLLEAQSRVRYRALVRLEQDLDREALDRLERDLRDHLGDDDDWVRVTTHVESNQRLDRSLSRVEDYLGLVALLSLLLGGIGVSQIVRAWLAGRTRTVAVMRCLGLRAREIAALYLGHVALLALVGCAVGGAVGAVLPWLVHRLAPDLFQGGTLHLWQPAAVVRGVSLGLLVALLFSLPPLTAVWRVAPAAVLRAEAAPLDPPLLVRAGAPVLLFLGVLASARVQGGSWVAGSLFAGGVVVLAALLLGGARLVMGLAGRVPRGRLTPTLEHGLAALGRPGAGTAGAITALGLGVMVVVSMIVVERRLQETLSSTLPEDAPSLFLVDVQPDQWEGVRVALEDHHARSIESVPVAMARLRGIDGRTVEEVLEERRRRGRRGGRWALTREQRLTWMEELPEDNEVVDGALWSDPDHAEVSIEADFAEDLGVGVGGELRLDVQGVPVDLRVTSLREVDWGGLGINFFLVVEPGVLEDAPHFLLATAWIDTDEDELALQNELASAHPNVTLLRIRPILEKLSAVVDRTALGVRALGGFSILAGLLILAGAIGATALRRSREAALLKTLGVTRAGVVRLFGVEYALSGLVAGAIGSAGALVLAWAFLEHTLELDSDVPLGAVPLAALAAAGLATVSGLAASVRALRARPLETLRG